MLGKGNRWLLQGLGALAVLVVLWQGWPAVTSVAWGNHLNAADVPAYAISPPPPLTPGDEEPAAPAPEPVVETIAGGPLSPCPVVAAPLSPLVPIGQALNREYAGVRYVLYVPHAAEQGRPLTVLVGMYGMGGSAEQFAGGLVDAAEAHNWVLLVPAFGYGDWRQIDAVRQDDRNQLPWLSDLLRALPGETGLPLRERALLYGFSRGAQAAHRFAIMYHDQVLAVAAMSAGTYTVPQARTPAATEGSAPSYPLGVGDLKIYCGESFDLQGVQRVAFWVGVGELDRNPADVPRAWDAYVGTNRVARARAFVERMASLGVPAEVEVFPDLSHAESAESRAHAFAFLQRVETAQWPTD